MLDREIKREAYFEDIFGSIVKHLRSAKYSVKICVAWITAERLGNILSQLKNRGVSIEIIFDDNHSNLPVREFLGEVGKIYPVRNRLGAFMHNKFCIIDDEILITGSFNWTNHADISLENALMVAGDYRLIKAYLHEFEDLKEYSRSCSLPRPIRPRHEDNSICCSLTFNIGVFGYLDHTCDTQTITVWNVCKAHRIPVVKKTLVVKGDFDEGDVLESGYFDNRHESREDMLQEFERERKDQNATPSFFSIEMESEIQAYGFIRPAPQPFKYDPVHDEDYCLDLEWRHPYWRKIIPSKLFYEDGEISKIIQVHSPHSRSSAYLQVNSWRDFPF